MNSEEILENMKKAARDYIGGMSEEEKQDFEKRTRISLADDTIDNISQALAKLYAICQEFIRRFTESIRKAFHSLFDKVNIQKIRDMLDYFDEPIDTKKFVEQRTTQRRDVYRCGPDKSYKGWNGRSNIRQFVRPRIL